MGASAAGISAADSLRQRGFTGRITLLGSESHLPCDRFPLSKQLLSGQWEPERLRLRRSPSPWPSSPDCQNPTGSSPPATRGGCTPLTQLVRIRMA
ncbi:NAD(P)/FAD-dependent oxidoreductase [Nonomuraea rubra]|uniref:NAD(P)/FAD-dependent oxidoreductase n=1 Tax=Nonomuraea rubra TaxID=46180 RepID=UPI0033FAC140